MSSHNDDAPTFRIADQEYDPAIELATVEPHPENVNEGDDGAVIESVDEHGFYGGILVQKSTRRILFGHTRYRAANARGATHLPGFWLDVDDDEARRILLVDNETNRKGRNRADDLAALLVELEQTPRGLAGTGFDTDDLGTILADLDAAGAPLPERKQVSFDAWDGVKPAQPSTELGDVWLVGPHRIMCGDAFEEEQLARLLGGRPAGMFLGDPPYAIYGSATGIASDIADDAMVRPFFRAMWRAIHAALDDYGHAYVHCDWRSYAAIVEMARGSGMESKNLLVWDKGGSGLGSNYANTHEFVAFFARIPKSGAMTGTRKTGARSVFASNVLRYNRPTGDDRQHNAAKPVEMLREFVKNSCDPGARVLDLFGGSGSTAIAAAAEGRVALVMEKEPAMVDVIVARLVKATGHPAEKETLAEL